MRTWCLIGVLLLCFFSLFSQETSPNIPAHDPVMIRQGNTYYLFCTGFGITEWSSHDMVNWKKEKPIMQQAPAWATEAVPGFKNTAWAPDISYYNGQYYLYYAVSAFGKNTSCIGLLTSPTLNLSDPDYHWTDRGKILQSHPETDDWNAIDPNLIMDKDSVPYLAFGSFWSGLKLIRLRKDGFGVDQSAKTMYNIASRVPLSPAKAGTAANKAPLNAGSNAIEAPFIFRKGKYFYLFASVDYCCRGAQSTYKMIVGRSKNVKGPYLDKSGQSLASGGGSILLAGDQRWAGVGHNAVCNFDGTDYLIFHGYDLTNHGAAKLRVEKLTWEKDWPVVIKKTP